MSRTLSLSVPHNLTAEQAKARIERGIGDLRSQFGAQVSGVEEKWTGNHLDFKFNAMGQGITGRADVEAQHVKLEVDLPWMLAVLADRIRPKVEQQARKMLE